MAIGKSKYDRTIEAIFGKYYSPGIQNFEFVRDEFIEVAEELGIS
jgi:hypothetical protein